MTRRQYAALCRHATEYERQALDALLSAIQTHQPPELIARARQKWLRVHPRRRAFWSVVPRRWAYWSMVGAPRTRNLDRRTKNPLQGATFREGSR